MSDSNLSTLPEPLALPAPPSADSQGSSSSTTASTPTQMLDVSDPNSSIQLDALGPMIVNSDGTLSRINNWAELTEIERQRVLRLLVKKRNIARLAAQPKEEGEASLSTAASS